MRRARSLPPAKRLAMGLGVAAVVGVGFYLVRRQRRRSTDVQAEGQAEVEERTVEAEETEPPSGGCSNMPADGLGSRKGVGKGSTWCERSERSVVVGCAGMQSESALEGIRGAIHEITEVNLEQAHQDLLMAVANDEASVVVEFLGNWNRSSSTPLHAASTYYAAGVCRALVAEQSTVIDAQDSGGYTALHLACDGGDLEIVQILVGAGASLEATTDDVSGSLGGLGVDLSISGGRTPLHCAAAKARVEVVRYLIDEGADATVRDFDEATPWQVCLREGILNRKAVSKGRLDCAAMLDPERPVPPLDALKAESKEINTQRARRVAASKEARELAKKAPREQGFEVSDDRRWLYNLNSENILPYLPKGTVTALSALNKAGDPTPLLELAEEITPGVFAIPLLSDELGDALSDEFDRVEQWATDTGVKLARPNSMNRYGLRVKEAGLQHVVEALVDVMGPAVDFFFHGRSELRRTAAHPEPLSQRYGFTIRYRGNEDRRLDTHVDASRVTLNICLGKVFQGGGVYFHKLRPLPAHRLRDVEEGSTCRPVTPRTAGTAGTAGSTTVPKTPQPHKSGGKKIMSALPFASPGTLAAFGDDCEDNEEDPDDPMERPHGVNGSGFCDRCKVLHEHSKGIALLHLGRHIHGAVNILEGERTNLVVWVRSSRDRY